MLHLDMCAPPCWIGIKPGVTKMTDVFSRLIDVFPVSHYRISGSSGIFTVQDTANSDLAFSVEFDRSGTIVKDFKLSFRQLWLSDNWGPFGKGLINFGELNSVWGSPKQISITCNFDVLPRYGIASNSYGVASPNQSVDTSSKISWDSTVKEIEMSDNRPSDGTDWQDWRGFLEYAQYRYDETLANCPF